ncbi:MAG: 23S rRNA (adenine(2030)-N(6))-methyltransferase RlmJ [Xanthobacteraceae bacterium]|jgi:23S rRNA (adenine2030-N6)-methyltransferase
MNYRHAFHAGNFADVVKHAVLARILVHLGEKPQPFRMIDTHAGAGLYDLAGPDASRTGEWRAGIGRLTAASLAAPVSALLAPYLDAVAKLNSGGELRHYPGSPLIALSLMRPQDRLIACELEPGAAAALRSHLHADKRAKAIAIDGFVALNAYVPPKERRGLVLIDPPFEQPNEFERLGQCLIDAQRKWSTGVYVAWYPRKDLSAVKTLINQIKRSGIAKVLLAELDVGNDATRLTGTGLLIINPPWRLDQELALLLPALADTLAQEQKPRVQIEALASS